MTTRPGPVLGPVSLPQPKPVAPRLPDAPVAMADDDDAEEVDEDTALVNMIPGQEAASFAFAPRWKPEDYRLLLAGKLDTGYTSLFPPAKDFSSSPSSSSSKGQGDSTAAAGESDSKIPGKYCDDYAKPVPGGLVDPQGLLSTPERADVLHVLRELNAGGKFRVYAAVVKDSQELPPEMAVGTLATAIAQPCEYAVLLLYRIGNPAALDMGYQEIKPDDALRHSWLNKARSAALAAGGGTEGMIAAIRCAAANIRPLADSFRPLTAESTAKAPAVQIRYKPKDEEKKSTWRQDVAAWVKQPERASVLPYLAALAFLGLVCYIVVRHRHRHSPELLLTDPDWRFTSPYGAGVSRPVRYLEGRESEKEKELF